MMIDNRLDAEQEMVAGFFIQGFQNYKDVPIVIYGIGKNTKAILCKAEDFNIIGLMDSKTVGQTIYGLPVLDEQEVISRNPVVVIVARDSVINIIYKRIEHLLLEYGIKIFNYRGIEINQDVSPFDNSGLNYWNYTEEDLKEEIKKHDVISFDVFDTLIMRRVLEPEDVFVLVEDWGRSEGYDVPFKSWRMAAEKACAEVPSFDDIYLYLQENFHMDAGLICRYRQKELEIEEKCLIPRRKMVDIYQWSVNMGKRVYLVSDMYLPAKILGKMLQDLGVTGYKELLVSCDYKKDKRTGELFSCLIQKERHGKILHIGDNRYTDIEKGKEAGLDVFHIYSASELLMASSMQEIMARLDTKEKRAILGLLVSQLLNDPFALTESRGKVRVCSLEEMGACFVAPMMLEFIQWLVRSGISEYDLVIFPSRDGFFVKKLYDKIARYRPVPPGCYLKSSRRAVMVPSIESESDILQILLRSFQGTIGELLYKRFGIVPKGTGEETEKNVRDVDPGQLKEIILRYKDSILDEAQKEKSNYLAYLNSCGVNSGHNYILFDFVAGGTVQYYFQKLINSGFQGRYFATMNMSDEMRSKELVKTAYGNFTSYDSKYCLSKYYLVLECILTDPDASLICIGEDGKFVFEEKENAKFPSMKKLQDAMLGDYADDYFELYGTFPEWRPQLEFADEIYGYLFRQDTLVADPIKEVFRNDDYFNGIDQSNMWP